MKIFTLILVLITACTQRGLLSYDQSITGTGSSSYSSGGSSTSQSIIHTASINENLYDPANPETYLTTQTPYTTGSYEFIQGNGTNYGNGNEYCISNERHPLETSSASSADQYDAAVPCFTPFVSQVTAQGATALSALSTALNSSTTLSNAKGYPMIIHALQLFINSTADTDTANYYAPITLNNVSVTTAPIKFDTTTGDFSWDPTKVTTFNYVGGTCSLSSPYSIGFDLSQQALTDSNFNPVDTSKLFLSGLWIFERSFTYPFEPSTIYPIIPAPDNSGGTTSSGPVVLTDIFSSRTRIFSSFIIPSMTTNLAPDYLFFPGGGGGTDPSVAAYYTPSHTPNPFEFSFGRYKDCNTLPNGHNPSNILAENSNCNDNVADVNAPSDWSNGISNASGGIYATPVMGHYDPVSHAPISNWQNNVVIGICINGTRTIYDGSTTPITTTNYPVIPAIKYELRSINVQVN